MAICMSGGVVVTHGRLADEFINAMVHMVGSQKNTAAMCIGPDDVMENVEAVEGVVVFTDMFGGTSSNLAISIIGKAQIEVIAGVNLPMLVKLASIREKCGLNETILMPQEAGKGYISIASQIVDDEKI